MIKLEDIDRLESILFKNPFKLVLELFTRPSIDEIEFLRFCLNNVPTIDLYQNKRYVDCYTPEELEALDYLVIYEPRIKRKLFILEIRLQESGIYRSKF